MDIDWFNISHVLKMIDERYEYGTHPMFKSFMNKFRSTDSRRHLINKAELAEYMADVEDGDTIHDFFDDVGTRERLKAQVRAKCKFITIDNEAITIPNCIYADFFMSKLESAEDDETRNVIYAEMKLTSGQRMLITWPARDLVKAQAEMAAKIAEYEEVIAEYKQDILDIIAL